MDINKESVFDTRPWRVFGEGPAAEASNPLVAQGFNERKLRFTSKDLRFAQKGGVVYATVMGVPDSDIVMKSLGTTRNRHRIKTIELLGSNERIRWTQCDDYVKVEKPSVIPNNIAFVFKVYQEVE